MDKKNLLNIKAAKFVFFGGADWSARILQQLITADWLPSLVITNQPHPEGRKQKMTQSAVFEVAKKFRLPAWEVKNLKDRNIQTKIYDLKPTIGILVALGMIVPSALIESFPKGIVNVHPSLLPKWRGPSPMQYSLLNGDTETAVSLMLLDKEIDHGPVLAQQKVNIELQETYAELSVRLSDIGSQLLLNKIPMYLSNTLIPITQNHSQATFCKMIKREHGQIDWQKKARQTYNQWRAFTPWPGIYTTWNGQRLKLIKISTTESKSTKSGLVTVDGDRLLVGCADNSIEVLELQLAGGKALLAKDFLRGHGDIAKSQLNT